MEAIIKSSIPWSVSTQTIVSLLLVILSLVSCSTKENHASHSADSTYTCPMHPQIVENKPGTCPICAMDLVPLKSQGNGAEIMLGESQIKLANITTTLTKYEMIGSTITMNGKLVVNEEETELVSSRVEGRIEKLAIKEIGQSVTKGQMLYEVYSEPLLTLENEYLLALQQTEELGAQNKRYQSFLEAAEKKLVLLGLTKAQVTELGKTKKATSVISFLSPVSGVVAQINASDGQYVSEGSPLYRIERYDKIWVEAEVYPNEPVLIKKGESVDVIISGFENIQTRAKVTFVSPEYRSGSQILTLRGELANPEKKFFPGMQANVIITHSQKRAIVLPTDAVIREEKGNHVWVLTPEGAYISKMVEMGIENEDKVEIVSGLEEKENVVITGAYLLYSEYVLKKGGDPMSGHSHL